MWVLFFHYGFSQRNHLLLPHTVHHKISYIREDTSKNTFSFQWTPQRQVNIIKPIYITLSFFIVVLDRALHATSTRNITASPVLLLTISVVKKQRVLHKNNYVKAVYRLIKLAFPLQRRRFTVRISILRRRATYISRSQVKIRGWFIDFSKPFRPNR